MSLAGDLLECARRIGARAGPPRVRALHRPPPAPDGKASSFCAVELQDGSVGLAYVSLGDTRARVERCDASTLAGAEAVDVIAAGVHGDAVARVLGIATLNALTAWLHARAGFEPPPAQAVLPQIGVGPGVHVGMVGLFAPLIEPLLASGARLTVIELDATLAGVRDGWRVTLEADALREADAVICTSTTLLNDTLEGVLARCTRTREFALIGPGAGCPPEPLFARGVTRIAGSRVTEAPALLEALRAGRSWGRHARKFDLSRDDYPGLAVLLGRL